MAKVSGKDSEVYTNNILRDKHYKDLKRKHTLRLSFTYVLPFIILIIFFQYEFNNLLSESQALHLKAIAENQSNLLDLFLKERVVNLQNLIDDPNLKIPPNNTDMSSYFNKLHLDCEAFIDLGFFDTTGIQIAYTGPLTILKKKDYNNEIWYKNLKSSNKKNVITDIYLGFRNQYHFTIAVRREFEDQYVVMKSSLEPKKIYNFMTKTEQSEDVNISIVNRLGEYQLVAPGEGQVQSQSPYNPPDSTKIGVDILESYEYAYAWLNEVDWAVIVKRQIDKTHFFNMQSGMIIISLFILILLIAMIIYRATKIAQMQIEKDIVRSQLEHASKLASVGELAGGIAHEINNPLAVIASEVGLIKDLMDPQFVVSCNIKDIDPHLTNIHDAAFRCRDITRKLLSFVRQDEIELKKHDLNNIIEEIIESFFERELPISNIDIRKHLQKNLPKIITDRNQFQQVLINIINNAVDAIKEPGNITVNTSYDGKYISISITDTGKGIKESDINNIFMPFFTTKEVGKGTGLGLSVSYGIIKNLGGNIEVESIYGKGSTFTIKLPVE